MALWNRRWSRGDQDNRADGRTARHGADKLRARRINGERRPSTKTERALHFDRVFGLRGADAGRRTACVHRLLRCAIALLIRRSAYALRWGATSCFGFREVTRMQTIMKAAMT